LQEALVYLLKRGGGGAPYRADKRLSKFTSISRLRPHEWPILACNGANAPDNWFRRY
jgi:hypothetical protein